MRGEASPEFFSADESLECVGRRVDGGSRGGGGRTVRCQPLSPAFSSSSLSVETVREENLSGSCRWSGSVCGGTRRLKSKDQQRFVCW